MRCGEGGDSTAAWASIAGPSANLIGRANFPSTPDSGERKDSGERYRDGDRASFLVVVLGAHWPLSARPESGQSPALEQVAGSM